MANNSNIICIYCHTSIVDVKNDMVICNSCGAPYHKEYWEEIDVCSIYGCNCENCHTVFEVNFNYEQNGPRETVEIEIEDRAFLNNKNLRTVKLGNCVEYLGGNVFAGCDNLERVELSRSTKCERDSFPLGVRKVYTD